VTDPTKTHPQRNAIKRLDGSMKDWTVLSEARDPFRLDTPSNHRDAAWLREVFERRPLPDSIQSNDQNLWMALGLVTWTGAPSRG